MRTPKNEIAKLWHLADVKMLLFLPVIISSMGLVRKSLNKSLDMINITYNNNLNIQKAVIQ